MGWVFSANGKIPQKRWSQTYDHVWSAALG